MKLVAIAAVGKNRELGLKGDMPWKRALKSDLRFFRKATLGRPVVMGRKTFESLPGILPGRLNIVITTHDLPAAENLITYSRLSDFLQEWSGKEETVFLMGGASLYDQLIDECDEILLTEIDSAFEADTKFPMFNKRNFDRITLDSVSESGYHYSHQRYIRKWVDENGTDWRKDRKSHKEFDEDYQKNLKETF